MTQHYVGRFAPSPSGPLHFGSLVAALASWLDARASRGAWLLRIEDLDPPRTQPGAADAIMRTLDRLGLHWDGPVVRQSTREALYRHALEQLQHGQAYSCACSRREIADSTLGLAPDGALVYPGTCRDGLPAGRIPRAVRVRTDARPVSFQDRVQGRVEQSLERQIGDFVVWRADGQYAYQLAVVVDDAEQGVTDIVRGADLLESTARQIHLQRLLGYPTVPAIRYAHVPVALSEQGEKLSKQTGAPPVDPARPAQELELALRFLGHQPPPGFSAGELLDWARAAWSMRRVPAVRSATPAFETFPSRSGS